MHKAQEFVELARARKAKDIMHLLTTPREGKYHSTLIRHLNYPDPDPGKHHVETKWTVLHYAARYGWQKCTKAIAEAGANLELRDSKGQTPLIVAAKHKHMGTVKQLVLTGADVDAQDSNGWTALIAVCEQKNVTACLYLLMHGANPHLHRKKTVRDHHLNAWRQLQRELYGGIPIKDHGGPRRTAPLRCRTEDQALLSLMHALEAACTTKTRGKDRATIAVRQFFGRCPREDQARHHVLGWDPREQRRNALLRWRRTTDTVRDAGYIFESARDGRPLELARRLRLGKLAGGLEIEGELGGTMVTPLAAAKAGAHEECVKLLEEAGAEI